MQTHKNGLREMFFFQFILNYLFDRRNQLVFYVNEFVFEDVLLGVQS